MNTNCLGWLSFILALILSAILPCAAEMRVLKDIAYAESSRQQTLDLYLPSDRQTPAPLVVWIHGGGYVSGKKTDSCLGYLLSEHYALASIDYRFSSEAIFPAQIQDCNAAINYLVSHAAVYGYDAKRLVVSGDSAGGHLALLVALARKEKTFGADPAVRPLGVIDFFGPTNFTSIRSQVSPTNLDYINKMGSQLFGGPLSERERELEMASPVSYIDSTNPAVLIVQGARDELVPPAQSRDLQSRLQKAGADCELILIEDAGHGGPQFVVADIRQRVLAFLRKLFGE